MVSTYFDALTEKKVDPVTTHQGGTAHKVDTWTRLRRFLILGTDGGSFYVNARDLTLENIGAVKVALAENGREVVNQIIDVSTLGIAPKADPAILALALASVDGNGSVRSYAFDAVPHVCRTGTHLMHFAKFRKMLGGGEGAGFKRAIRTWFQAKDAKDLAYTMAKYQSRDGYSLTDLLRMGHVPLKGDEWYVALHFRDMLDGMEDISSEPLCEFLRACTLASREDSSAPYVVDAIRANRLPREIVNTAHLNNPNVWDALLESMPMTATIRNLNKMTAVGLLTDRSAATKLVYERLTSEDALRKARVHPMSLLVALKTYEQGHGRLGSLSWTPIKRIVNALDEAFYLAFAFVEPTNLRYELGIDCSGSMQWESNQAAPGLTSSQAAAAMALVTAATEPDHSIKAFGTSIVELAIRPSMRLDEVTRVIERTQMGGTNPNQLIDHAENGVDVFVTYTDNETGNQYALWRSLEDYRQRDRRNRHARNAVVAFMANAYSVANPDDPRQCDFIGFDSSLPTLLSAFATGRM